MDYAKIVFFIDLLQVGVFSVRVRSRQCKSITQILTAIKTIIINFHSFVLKRECKQSSGTTTKSRSKTLLS